VVRYVTWKACLTSGVETDEVETGSEDGGEGVADLKHQINPASSWSSGVE